MRAIWRWICCHSHRMDACHKTSRKSHVSPTTAISEQDSALSGSINSTLDWIQSSSLKTPQNIFDLSVSLARVSARGLIFFEWQAWLISPSNWLRLSTWPPYLAAVVKQTIPFFLCKTFLSLLFINKRTAWHCKRYNYLYTFILAGSEVWSKWRLPWW